MNYIPGKHMIDEDCRNIWLETLFKCIAGNFGNMQLHVKYVFL
jgi:hypothetical protein